MVLFGELTDEVGISVVGEAWMIWFWWESNDDDDDHNVDGDYDYDDDDVDVDVDDDDVDDDDVDDDDVDDDVDDDCHPRGRGGKRRLCWEKWRPLMMIHIVMVTILGMRRSMMMMMMHIVMVDMVRYLPK